MATYFKGVLLTPRYPIQAVTVKRSSTEGLELSNIAAAVMPNLFYGFSMNRSFNASYIQSITPLLTSSINTINNSFILPTSVPTQLINTSVRKGFMRGKTNIVSINILG